MKPTLGTLCATILRRRKIKLELPVKSYAQAGRIIDRAERRGQ